MTFISMEIEFLRQSPECSLTLAEFGVARIESSSNQLIFKLPLKDPVESTSSHPTSLTPHHLLAPETHYCKYG